MDSVVFVTVKDSWMAKLHSHKFMIHRFLIQMRQTSGTQTIADIHSWIGSHEPDPHEMDKRGARFFTFPECAGSFIWIPRKNDMANVTVQEIIEKLNNHLTYKLFPKNSEFNRGVNVEVGSGRGDELRRLLEEVPKDTLSYFQHDWEKKV